MFIEKYFLNKPALKPSSRATFEELALRAPEIAGICRQLSNTYVNAPNANVLSTAMNLFACLTATRIVKVGFAWIESTL
jgi:hypothetical protein